MKNKLQGLLAAAGVLLVLVVVFALRLGEGTDHPSVAADRERTLAVSGSPFQNFQPSSNPPTAAAPTDEAALRPTREDEESEIDSSWSSQEIADFRAAALAQPPDPQLGLMNGDGDVNFVLGTAFDSLDILECCATGGLNPPDPELAVGPDHIVAVVNAGLEIYDKSGVSLVGPLPFPQFYSSIPGPCTSFPFDPNVLYDESADRYLIAADGNGDRYCVGVSQTGDPTGDYFFYAFPVDVGGAFFDYPHAGIGRDALYIGANMFGDGSERARIYAFDKLAMYDGLPADSASQSVPIDGTPQPLKLHGTFPDSGPHYYLVARGGTSNIGNFGLLAWDDPFGEDVLTDLGSLDVASAHGIGVFFTVPNRQPGAASITGFNPRPLDFEYRNGSGWMVNNVSCNPGSLVVNCIQWAEINLAEATIEQAGVFALDDGHYRFLPDLAVNACGDMMVGYSVSSPTTHAGIRAAGREASDPPGTMQGEVEIKAGEVVFGGPDRWGDYTGMTIDPDGTTFWYLGEYSKDIPDDRNWGTYIGSLTFAACNDVGIFADGLEGGDASAWPSTTSP